MKYDVFISYSRKDIDVANKLCEALDSARISYWIDRNIHGSANFLSEITRYIRECKVVVFIASSNSAVSMWTQKEILFALKHNKPIVPYRIGDFSFENNDELDFVFMNVQWIESVADVVTSLERLGCTVAEKAEVKVDAPAAATKTYKIGDYYDDGVKQGVVFAVRDNGRHGKIVSLDQEALQWCSEDITIGASSERSGKANTDKAMAHRGVTEFPAFKWCRAKGAEWYMPAISELEKLLMNDDTINRTLREHNAAPLFDIEDLEYYWSSTEVDNGRAFCVCTRDGDYSAEPKRCDYYVRAIAAF